MKLSIIGIWKRIMMVCCPKSFRILIWPKVQISVLMVDRMNMPLWVGFIALPIIIKRNTWRSLMVAMMEALVFHVANVLAFFPHFLWATVWVRNLILNRCEHLLTIWNYVFPMARWAINRLDIMILFKRYQRMATWRAIRLIVRLLECMLR